MPLAREIEAAAEVPLGPQPSRGLAGQTVRLGAYMKAQHHSSHVFVEELQLYLNASRGGMIGELRVKNIRFNGLETLKNWLRTLTWKDCMNLLNAHRTASEEQGGFTVKVESEFDKLKTELITKIN